jgi:hypothetical protein
MPLGFITTNKDAVKIIGALITEYVKAPLVLISLMTVAQFLQWFRNCCRLIKKGN